MNFSRKHLSRLGKPRSLDRGMHSHTSPTAIEISGSDHKAVGYKIILLIFCLIFGWFIWNLKIKHIECYTQFGLCDDKYFQVLNSLIGHKIFNSPLSTEKKIQTDFFDSVKSVSVSRRLPSSLIFVLTLRQPVCQLNSALLGIDQDGMVIPLKVASSLPNMITSKQYKSRDHVDSSTLKAASLGAELSQFLHASFSVYYAYPVIQADTNYGKIIFDINHLPDDWQQLLQKLFTRSKITSRIPKTIDLRFSDPILTY